MVDKSALDRIRAAEAGSISDCMMRLGLSGWMDGVRPIQSGNRRAAGPARTLLFGPKRGEGQWSRSMYRNGVMVVPESRVTDVLYQLEDVEVCERDLQHAIKSRAPLDDIEAVLKRKKALRLAPQR